MNDYSVIVNKLESKEKNRRIFFCLWPDDSTRKKIVEAFEQSPINKNQGHIVPPDNLHLTLHFIGHVNREKLNCLHRAAQTLKADRFNLELDHFGYFKKPKVLWMGLKKTTIELVSLHKTLADLFVECDYQSEQRPYSPHISLMRKLPDPEIIHAIKPISFSVNEFCLVESISIDGGVHYEVIERYFLK